jgi:ribosome-associated translation inhibitor RaiA
MHHAVEFKSLEPKEPIRQLVENLIGWLDRKSRNLPPEVLFLRCIVEEIPAHKLYRVTVTLSVPGKTLAATNQTYEVTDTVRTVFAEIERQLEAYKADLRGEPWWKRLARRYKLRLQKAGLQSAEAYEAPSAESEPHAVRQMQPAFEKSEASQFFQLVRPHIDKLNHFVRHVLLQAEARGDLALEEVAPEDIVDAALIRAYNEFYQKAGSRNDQGARHQSATVVGFFFCSAHLSVSIR